MPFSRGSISDTRAWCIGRVKPFVSQAASKNNQPTSKQPKAKKITTPTRRTCGASEAHQRLCECDLGFRARRNLIHMQAETFMLNGRAAKSIDSGKIRTLPGVVHVVYSTPEENTSVKQVKSQIKVLNRDYSATNPDKTATPTPWKGLIIDSRIRFALAKKDPEGKPTTGITRTKTDTALFGTHDEVKSSATGGVNVRSELQADALVERGPGPGDAATEKRGTWSVLENGELSFFRGAERKPARVLKVISVQPERLVVRCD